MIKIIPIEKNDEDAKLILEWRNNEISRKNSFNSELKTWESFREEFYNNYFKNISLFATYNDKKIATVYFIYSENLSTTVKIGINIDPNYRGKGLGSRIITEGIEYVKNNYKDIKNIIAEIKSTNIASIKSFIRTGFIFENNINVNGELINVYSFSI